MGSIGGEDQQLKGTIEKTEIPSSREEKILVLVRLRPLSEKEIAASEVADWECINDTTILYRNTLREGSTFPSAYSFDQVFRGDCSTRQVYDGSAREVALSVVDGVNSSIFAYGQTSSGKTYTMLGITEYAVADIFDYVHKHEERAFVLKFSAIEIYNEAIRDLLSSDCTPLRLLDDPEKGTIVEKVTEETLKDWNHLKDLLSVCEAQRRIGETSLNEKSSRSHQILRLTIESSAREFLGKENSTTLVASVNFVDLAGSERASQALSTGARLKEGCHINRSLLTLGTVIRKLSKGRHGHINFRDSKLTRLLQPALGGNARTAIICTLSPARSHVEQTRNTLLFARFAKEVTTKAQVNVVMSDKALVKHLQRELARLESELRSPVSVSSNVDYASLMRKKDLQIQKMEKEIIELTKQRDLAESRVKDLLRSIGNDQNSRDNARIINHFNGEAEDSWEDECSISESGLTGTEYLNGGTPNFNMISHNGDSEDDDEYCKEVQCVEMNDPRRRHDSESSSRSVGENEGSLAIGQEMGNGDREASPTRNGFTYDVLEQRHESPQRTMDSHVGPEPNELSSQSSTADNSNVRLVNLSRSWSGRENAEQNESTPPNGMEKLSVGRPESVRRRFPPLNYDMDTPKLSRSDSQSSLGSVRTSGDEDIPSIHTFVAGLEEAKHEYERQLVDNQETEENKPKKNVKDVGLGPMEALETSNDWSLEFERQQRAILELWQTCNVSLVHRTYFFMLFKGDQRDSVYMEVELRRLSFLKQAFSHENQAIRGDQTLTLAGSLKALHRERRMLSKLMMKRFSEEERKKLYQKFCIEVNSKCRRLQLANCLWSNTTDINHVSESAAVVARLIKFAEKGQALKEMFGLSFTPPSAKRRSLGWSYSRSSLL